MHQNITEKQIDVPDVSVPQASITTAPCPTPVVPAVQLSHGSSEKDSSSSSSLRNDDMSSDFKGDEPAEARQGLDHTHESILTSPERHDGAKTDHESTGGLEKTDTTSSAGLPHTIFSPSRKRFIIFMAAFAALFSPLSANIFYPALNQLSNDLHVSSSLINLSLTTYTIFQGLAPTFVADLADTAGRRPAYVTCFIIYIGACIGLAVQTSYAALLVLRCMQSSGSSGTVALAAGVASDIATAAQRGSYMGWVNGGALIGPAIGPIIGGLLAQYLGWRWIFWFLAILAGAFIIPLVLLFPETCRKVVANGSIPPQSWNRDLVAIIRARRNKYDLDTNSKPQSQPTGTNDRAVLAAQRKPKIPNPLMTVKILLEKDVASLLLYSSLVYTAFYMLAACIPYIFSQLYGFDALKIGLCFIPFGSGAFCATIINGKVMDALFRRVAKRAGISIVKGKNNTMNGFPIEQARIPLAMVLILMGNSSYLAFGWGLHANMPLAPSLVLLFILGYALTGSFNCTSVLLIDYYPNNPAAATACNNLCRCLLGAGGSAVIIPMLDAWGRGPTFTLIAGIIYLTTPILWVLLRWGPQWREARTKRLDAEKQEC